MDSKRRGLILTIVVAILLAGAATLLTPFLGPARWGPMRGFNMGPMSFGMMREVHAMADVESEVDYMIRMIPHLMAAVMMSQ